MARALRIGVIADTHGLLRPEALAALAHVDHIIHAGDIGGDDVLASLREIAPVTFVEGNNDGDSDGTGVVRVNVGDFRVLLTHVLPRPHDPDERVLDSLRESPADVVVFGHSHLPHDERVNGVWYFNPASAGPRRFDYPVSVGVIEKTRDGWRGRHIALDDRSVGALKQRMNQLNG
jgi:putative phosphoesterase